MCVKEEVVGSKRSISTVKILGGKGWCSEDS